MEKLIVRKIATGWQIVQFKEKGLNKGETVLVTTCGGNLGRSLAMEALKFASKMTMITEFLLEDETFTVEI